MPIDPSDFLAAVQPPAEPSHHAIGTVKTTTGGVQFDGEAAASGMIYPHHGSYTPVVNDRVALTRYGDVWVIEDKLVGG